MDDCDGPSYEYHGLGRSFDGNHELDDESITSPDVESVPVVTNVPEIESVSIESVNEPDADEPDDDFLIDSDLCQCSCHAAKRPPKCVKQFDEVERLGTEVTYRCPDCRLCGKCKSGGRIDDISIQDENEQALIEKSVVVYPEKGFTEASLPFVVDDPDSRLAPNEHVALKVFNAQVRRLDTRPDDKLSIIESRGKVARAWIC